MFPGLAPVTGAPVAGWPFILTSIPPVPEAADAEAYEDAIHLLRIAAYSGVATTIYLPPAVVTGAPVAGLPFGTALSGQVATLKVSDRGWLGDPDDALAPNELYEGRLDEVPGWEQQIPIVPESTAPAGRTFGDLPLDNLDGALEGWPETYAVAGRQVEVLRAPWNPSDPPAFADFSVLYQATMSGWLADETTLRIALGGARSRMANPAQVEAYGGTGGAEGDSTWTDVLMPGAYGRCRNVTPDLIDTVNLVYRVHDRRVQAISAVRDRGNGLTFDADYADYAALVAASLASGEYATCLAEGLFRLESKNTDAVITADVDGDVDDDGVWAETHAEIAKRLLKRGGITELSNATFVDGWPAGTAKLWLPSSDLGGTPTLGEALDRLRRSVAGFLLEDRTGRIAIGRLTVPSTATAAATIGEDDLRGDIEEIDPPRPPRWRQRVGYRRNETLQDRFAAGVAEADQNTWRTHYRSPAQDSDSDIAARYPFAPEPPLHESLFDDEADGLALAQHLMDLHGPDRRIHRLPVGPLASFLEPGEVVVVTYPRGGFAQGKPVIVVGVDDRAGSITVWG